MDPTIYSFSDVKTIIESHATYKVAADSAYSSSLVLMKPYPRDESLGDPRKARFNTKLCQIRTCMTEMEKEVSQGMLDGVIIEIFEFLKIL